MKKLDGKKLAEELEKTTALACEFRSDDECILVSGNGRDCLWTWQLERIREFCQKYSFLYYVDFRLQYLIISL